MALNRTLAALGFLAAAIVLCMVAGILATGGFSQEFFELSPSPAAVAAQLTDQPAHTFGLRLNVGLDNLFIIAYSAFFVLLAVRLRGLLSPITIGVALGAHRTARCRRESSHSSHAPCLPAQRAAVGGAA
jgi:hypothetical protein